MLTAHQKDLSTDLDKTEVKFRLHSYYKYSISSWIYFFRG